jgi:hypothetical protein
MLGLFGDGSVGSPSGPVQIGTDTVGHHADGQGAAWQTLVLMLGLVLIMGAAVMMYVVIRRTRLLARRRARAARTQGQRAVAVAADPAEASGTLSPADTAKRFVEALKQDWSVVTEQSKELWERARSQAATDEDEVAESEQTTTSEYVAKPETEAKSEPEPQAKQNPKTAAESTGKSTAKSRKQQSRDQQSRNQSAGTASAAQTAGAVTPAGDASPRQSRRTRVTA